MDYFLMGSDEDVVNMRLAAILFADMAGFSRLMSADEITTIGALGRSRALFADAVDARAGRIVDMAGDSVLAIFPTALGAIEAASLVQSRLAAAAADTPPERSIQYRIGVHVGDVIERPDGTVYGHGVNIAARLQLLAEPGGLCVSDAVRAAVCHRLSADFEDLGEREVNHIACPVRVFRVISDEAEARDRTASEKHAGLARARPIESRDDDLATLDLQR